MRDWRERMKNNFFTDQAWQILLSIPCDTAFTRREFIDTFNKTHKADLGYSSASAFLIKAEKWRAVKRQPTNLPNHQYVFMRLKGMPLFCPALPPLQNKLWRAMCMLGEWTTADLASAAEARKDSVYLYTYRLLKAGYCSSNGRQGIPVYRLVRNTGVFPPGVYKNGDIFDRNTGEVHHAS